MKKISVIAIISYLLGIPSGYSNELIRNGYENVINIWWIGDKYSHCNIYIDNCLNDVCDYRINGSSEDESVGKIHLNEKRNMGIIDNKNYKIEIKFDKSSIAVKNKNKKNKLCEEDNDFFKNKKIVKAIDVNSKIYKTGFDCSNLNHISDILVCMDKNLSELDLELNKTFNYVKKVLNKEDFKKVQMDQKKWNIKKNSDGDFNINNSYDFRIEELSSYIETCNNDKAMNLIFSNRKLAKKMFYNCVNSNNIYEKTGKILNNHNSVEASSMLSYLYFIENNIQKSNEFFKQIMNIAYLMNSYWFPMIYNRDEIPDLITDKLKLLKYLQYFFPYYTQKMILNDNDLIDYLGETKWGHIEIKYNKNFKNITTLNNVEKLLNDESYKKNIKSLGVPYELRGTIRSLGGSIANAFFEKISLLPKKYFKDDINKKDVFIYELVSEDDAKIYFGHTFEKMKSDKKLMLLYNNAIKDIKDYYINNLNIDTKNAEKYAEIAVKYIILYDVNYR